MRKNLALLFTAATIVVEIIFLFVGTAAAHKPSDSYLTLTVLGDRIDGRWDISLRDLDHAIGLDLDQDGRLTWGEVKRHHEEIAAYALARLSITTGNADCRLAARPQLVENHGDGAYTVLPFTVSCGQIIDGFTVRYGLLFDLDTLHRGLLQVRERNISVSSVLSPDNPAYRWRMGQGADIRNFLSYVRDGIWHILIGFDHILFLVCLLLPAAMRRVDGQWKSVATWREAVWPVVQMITAFTLSHSVTLSAGALGLIELPSWLVESVIALSIVAAALNNIRPLVTRRLWLVAFAFGLVHGFGFAGVLADLGLPQDALIVSLVAFNLGIELGQLAIVLLVLPLIYWLRLSAGYTRRLMPAGSAISAAVAMVWLFERTTGMIVL